ncbi:MAG TPA: BRO family protein [Cyclobacteriaceae bacterium]|nr:BRO family protein [Cyclobacteriaceae bacterium]
MSDIKLFESKKIRSAWNDDEEKWYFSVQDVVDILTDSADIKQYIKKLKSRDPQLFANWGTICTLVEMTAADDKKRKIQAANTEGLFRIIQSIPSAKAEPFKQWLAKVGYERIEETEDPELSFDRAMETYLAKGYTKAWINQRLKSIEVRKELTDEWEKRGVQKGMDFAILTDIITKAWSGKSVKQYKKHKVLKKENLRDHMTNLELVLNMLAEATTSEISKKKKPTTLDESKIIAKQGGAVAGNARKEIEVRTGDKVVSKLNARQIVEGKPKNKLK